MDDQLQRDETTMPVHSDEQADRLEAAIATHLEPYNIDELTTHFWCKGLYCRVIELPADTVAVGKRHAVENFLLLVRGEMSLSVDEGVKRIAAPYMVKTMPGDKRVGYTHTNVTMITFHPNPDDCEDVSVLESRYIIEEPALTDERVRELLEDAR